MTDHEEIRYLLRAILGELRVANELRLISTSDKPLMVDRNGDWVKVKSYIDNIREEYNTP